MKHRTAKRVSSAIAVLRALPIERDPLRQLDLARSLRELCELIESALVEAARDAGHTWTEIGALYGMSKQGAQQRFAKSTR